MKILVVTDRKTIQITAKISDIPRGNCILMTHFRFPLDGDRDTFIMPSAALSFSERIERSEIVLLPEVGHLPMLEAPIDTKAAIEQFLDQKLSLETKP